MNEHDVCMFLLRDHGTQVYKHEPQQETHDCPSHPKCLNQYDILIKPPLFDKYVQINVLIPQIEYPDCQKHHLCFNQQDKFPVTDIYTQTLFEYIPLDEIIDLPKQYTLKNQSDDRFIGLDPLMEYFDQYKYPTIKNLGDTIIISIQEENSDRRKNSKYLKIYKRK